MRFSCDVFIEIDIIRAIENNIPFFISENSVILTPGENEKGFLSKDYFRQVKSKNGEILYKIKYDYAIFINYKNDKIESFYIFDIIGYNKIKEIPFSLLDISELEKFELLTNVLIDMKLFKEKICISFFNKNEKTFIDFVLANYEEIKQYRSFYCFYKAFNKDLDIINKKSYCNSDSNPFKVQGDEINNVNDNYNHNDNDNNNYNDDIKIFKDFLNEFNSIELMRININI
jgi:hypothetical protein